MALSTGEATIYVSKEQLKELLEEAGGITLPRDACVVYGGFRITEEEELEFSVAWDATDNHPCDWATPPSFLRKNESS